MYGHVSFTGMANVDLADFMDVFPEVKVQTLSNLAAYLGATKSETALEIEDVEFADYWDDPQKRELLKTIQPKQRSAKFNGCACFAAGFCHAAFKFG